MIKNGLKSFEGNAFDTPEALPALMGVPRMIPAGFGCLGEIPASRFEGPEEQLYAQLGKINESGAYGEYNSMRNRLSSFLSALEARYRREQNEKC